jgi:hypothetical protein
MAQNSKFGVDTNLFQSTFEGQETVTLHGLEKWTNHMYEILGWVTLADKHNNSEKVVSYINSIPKLKDAIQYRHKQEGTSASEKNDLEALGRKVEHLYNISDKLFNYQELSNKLCKKCEQKISSESVTLVKVDNGGLIGGAKKSKKASKKSSKKASKKYSKKGSKLTGGAKKYSKKASKKRSKKSSKKSKKN